MFQFDGGFSGFWTKVSWETGTGFRCAQAVGILLQSVAPHTPLNLKPWLSLHELISRHKHDKRLNSTEPSGGAGQVREHRTGKNQAEKRYGILNGNWELYALENVFKQVADPNKEQPHLSYFQYCPL